MILPFEFAHITGGSPRQAFRPLVIFGVIFFLSLLAWAGPVLADGELVRAIGHRDEFLKSAKNQQSRANWLALIKEFEEAATLQGQAKHASRARYLGADAALRSAKKFGQKTDYDKAAALARRAVKDCPRCTHGPAAQLIIGQALIGLKQLDQAYSQLMKIELNYPESLEIEQSRRLMAELRRTPSPQVKTGQTNPPPTKAAAPKKTSKTPLKVKIPKPPKARADGMAQVYFLTLEDFGEYTSVTAYVDKVTPYVYNLIPPQKDGGNFRAYADFKNCVIAPGVKLQLADKTNAVKLVKLNQFKNDVARLVVDMPEAHPYMPYFLDQPPRLVINVAKDSSDLPIIRSDAQPEPPAKAPPATQLKEPDSSGKTPKGPADSMARQLGLKVRTIVIDPGHGGKDNGTSGFDLKEKDVVLKLSKKLKTKLEKRLGVAVYLTRSEDKFITLERRTKIAKEKKADLFISIHANANASDKVEGFETYILNFATNKSAMAVAARENALATHSVAELEDVLKLIAKNTKVAESRTMAQAAHKTALSTLNKKHKVRDLGVKEAPFFVLVGTNVPSILVEVGFLSNEKEAELLKEDAYLELIADGLCDGVVSYVKGF